jgi:hypothetical protein
MKNNYSQINRINYTSPHLQRYGGVSISCKGVHRVSQPENQSRVKLLIYMIKVCQINAPITVYNLNPSKRYVD